jgi:hypothetical protein
MTSTRQISTDSGVLIYDAYADPEPPADARRFEVRGVLPSCEWLPGKVKVLRLSFVGDASRAVTELMREADAFAARHPNDRLETSDVYVRDGVAWMSIAPRAYEF